jgi:hypothetical protein
MAKAKQWTRTDLSANDTLVIEIGGVNYRAASITVTYALNRVPTAVAVLAIGRDVRTQTAARIQETAKSLKTMLPCKIKFKAEGEFDSEGRLWPEGEHVIFDGYFQGFSHRKYRGKVQVVANMIHWLVDLGFSSSLSSLHHSSNPASLLAPAVFPKVNGAKGKPIFVANHIGHDVIEGVVESDLWRAIHEYMTELAKWKDLQVNADLGCFGSGDPETNERALRALIRIEGHEGLGKERAYSRPLPLETDGLSLVRDAVASAIQTGTLESYFNQTFWNVLVGAQFPQFLMAMVPMADRALIIADTPGYRGEIWRTIGPDEYVFTEQNSSIPMPMRGVAVYSGIESESGAVRGTVANQIGGCFKSDAQSDADGVIRFVDPPAWLRNVPSTLLRAGKINGNEKGETTKSENTPDSGNDPVDGPEQKEIFSSVSKLLGNFAQGVFMQNNLRGRSVEIAGKLRFDIAPGSHVKIEGSPEQFLAGVDVLAADGFATVWRTTIAISAEEKQALTALSLSHLRNDEENQSDRTSVAGHPLFKDGSVIAGAPILPSLEFKDG